MAEELLVVLNRSENSGFGFSLLGKPGLPPIIYNILDDSPAAESGEVEVGDVILKVNETDVIKYSTKEVLKCLRLSSDPVTLKIKRDPKIKSTIKKHLLSTGALGDFERPLSNITNRTTAGYHHLKDGTGLRPEPAVHRSHQHGRHNAANGRCPPTPEQEPLLAPSNHHQLHNDRLHWNPNATDNRCGKDTTDSGGGAPTNGKGGPPKFEAYMMTGEKILNISKVTQAASIIPKQQKKVDNLRYHNSHAHHLRHQPLHNSVPNSPNEAELGSRITAPPAGAAKNSGSNSANTSPVSANRNQHPPIVHSPQDSFASNNYVRNSRSEDQLQQSNNVGMGGGVSTANMDADEDCTSSLNTLLDTRPDSAASDSDRIVWTYNAPISELQKLGHTLSNGSNSSHTSASSSPLHSNSPNSPTSVSSSVMSSQSGSRRVPYLATNGPQHSTQHTDYSVSEAISNISSPDYHDDDSVGIRDYVMEISDHSDSDSTLLVSEPRQRLRGSGQSDPTGDGHRIVIQVRGPDKRQGGSAAGDSGTLRSDGHYDLQDYQMDDDVAREDERKSSPHSSEDESDVESLHSFHYSPKAVDMPSAIRLAKRLYNLEGFKKSDVSRHLSKNNDFSRAVAEEYLKYFDFEKDSLDIALRKFLKQFSLTGETQERERVLVHFSKRYLECNPGSFNSSDAVHTLTCAIMLLNTDLHGPNVGHKMTCGEFIENLSGLNENENFSKDVLRHLYQAIKSHPLEWALDEEQQDANQQLHNRPNEGNINIIGNPFLDVPNAINAVEYKKSYVMRKCCYEANAKRTPFHKRSWKMFCATLRDMVLYLHKDENGFSKKQLGGDSPHNAIRIHHALATAAQDYTKKQYVFRLQTADQAEYLFQTSNSDELQSWIDTINFVAARFSAPPLEAAVGSQKKFQRPLLPCSHTKLSLGEQLQDHEERVTRLEGLLEEHKLMPPEKGSKSLVIQNYKEKEVYLLYELKRYRTYSFTLRSKMTPLVTEPVITGTNSLLENCIGEVDETAAPSSGTQVTLMTDGSGSVVPPPIPDRRQSPISNRYSYRQAIYSGGGGGFH